MQLNQTHWDQLELNYEVDQQGWTIGDDWTKTISLDGEGVVGVPNPLASAAGNLSILESGQLQRQWWCFWWTVSTCIWMEYQSILQFFNQRVFNFIHFKIFKVGLIPDSPGYGLNLTKGTSFWLKHLEKKTFDLIDFWEERTLFSAITLFAFNFSFSNTFIQVCWFAYTNAL